MPVIAGIPTTPLVPITVLLILRMVGSNSFVPVPLINLQSLRGYPHSTSPTEDRAHCSPDEVRAGSVTAVNVGHATPQSLTDGQLRALVRSTPVLSSSWSTGAFESTTLVLQTDGWVWVQIRLSPGLHLVDSMTSHKHSIFDLDDQFQTNAPPHCPSARLRQ